MDWEQLRTILWLRWRLTRNQWRRDGGLGAALTVLVLLLATLGAVGAAVGGFCGGYFGLAHASAETALLAWDAIAGAFLFVWAMGVLTEIQRSETIDIGRLLHLPISLRDVFAINFIASHFSLSLILFVPGMLALVAGHAVGQSPRMLLLAPAVLGFVFMVTAWTYCLRGWLVALMVNKRRRRTILMVLGISLVLVGQLPNLYFNVFRLRDRKPAHKPDAASPAEPRAVPRKKSNRLALTPRIESIHKFIPPLWVANSALALGRGSVWPAVAAATGATLLGALGMMRVYRSTIRFYRGDQPVKVVDTTKLVPGATADRAGARFLERNLPGVPEAAAAVALANFRSLVRAPEVKMALASPFLMVVVFGSMVLAGHPGAAQGQFKPFILSGVVAMSLFGMTQLFCNQFGFDRDGFRALVLLPHSRAHLLLGKNLSIAPFALGGGAVLLCITAASLRISFPELLLGGLQLLIGFLLTALSGNFFSIVAPYRMSSGSLKPTKTGAKTTILILVSHLIFPMLLLPVMLPIGAQWLCVHFGWLDGLPVDLLLALPLLSVVALLYWHSLKGLGHWLEQREKDILQVVTQEVE